MPRHFENENLSWQLDNEFSLSKCHHFVKSSEAFRGMKMASNRKNKTTFTFTTFWAYGVKVVLFFRFEAVFMPKTGSRKKLKTGDKKTLVFLFIGALLPSLANGILCDANLQIWQSGDILTTKIRCPIVMTNFRSQNVTTLSKNEIRSQNVVADEDTLETN